LQGGSGPRLLAGTALDLSEEVRAGRLLERLHAWLSTLVIALPPLRQRLPDLPELVDRLLVRAREEDGRSVVVAPSAGDLLRSYPWPGNVSELYAVLQSARRRATGERIEASHLPAAIRQAVRLDQTPGAVPDRVVVLDRVLEEAERRLIQGALRRAQGNKSRAAELLAISRPRLLRRMEVLGIRDGETEAGK
jgi:DNA-binding NtrC family response regulator